MEQECAAPSSSQVSLPVALLCCLAAALSLVYAIAAHSWYLSARRRREELGFEVLRMRNVLMHEKESTRAGSFPSFVPKADDVFVVTYPKCGTTWMMQIVHGLRSGGSMDFGEITEECPWDIMAGVTGQDLNAAQRFHPRVFKSHETFPTIGKTADHAEDGVGGAKYIYVVRDPRDAFLSFFHFLPAYAGLQAGDLDMETFCSAIFAGVSHSGAIWEHMVEWYHRRQHANVLFLHFESLLDDLDSQVRMVAKFLNLNANNEEILQRVVAQSSYSFMSEPENKHHFDDHFLHSKCRDNMMIPEDYTFTVGKVRKGGGRSGKGRREVPRAVQARLEHRWREAVREQIGFQRYEDLRRSIEAENRQRFA